MPASTLVYRGGRIRTERYWRLDYSQKRPEQPAEELHEEIRDTLRRAVRRRMVADVPTGAFLSGGIDSSAVVAAMAESSPQPVKTFSIGFEEERFNELPKARLVAQQFSTDHHELIVRPDAVELLPSIVRHYGEPFADHSALPCFYLARFAREHVTVALNGDGGDESFAGYQRYTTNLALAELDRVPAALRRGASALARALPLGADPRALRSRLGRFAVAAGLDRENRYLAQRSVFTQDERMSLYAPEHRATLDPSRAADAVLGPVALLHRRRAPGPVPGRRRQQLPAQRPAGEDRHRDDGPLARGPLTAARPRVHGARRVAARRQLKADRGRRKRVLRSALRGWVPDAILDGPKQGFELPVSRWLRGDLSDYAREVLLDRESRSRGWCDEQQVGRLLDEHIARQPRQRPSDLDAADAGAVVPRAARPATARAPAAVAA